MQLTKLAPHCTFSLPLRHSPAQDSGLQLRLMGQSLEAKDEKLAERYTKMCQKIGLFLAIMMSVSIYFGATLLAGMYTDNVEIIQNTSDCFINCCVRSTIPKPSIDYFWSLTWCRRYSLAT